MLKRLTLPPTERVLVVSPINRYKISGPGRVWLKPRQRVAAKIYVGPRGQSLVFERVRTAENIPVKIKVQLLAQVDPALCSNDMLPKLPGLNGGGWDNVISWQTEYVLRLLVAQQPWQRLSQETVQKRLERQLTETLADRLTMVGLRIINAAFVSIELPGDLQDSIVAAQQDLIRAELYREIFGNNLAQAMPQIAQWELLNAIRTNKPNIWLNGSAPGSEANGKAMLSLGSGDDPPASRYQMGLPLQ
ncbi:MAG: hypothetical protein Kow0031_15120 [Anaerolineae bacterium]